MKLRMRPDEIGTVKFVACDLLEILYDNTVKYVYVDTVMRCMRIGNLVCDVRAIAHKYV